MLLALTHYLIPFTFCMTVSFTPRHKSCPFSSIAAKSMQPASFSSVAQMHHSVRKASSGCARHKKVASRSISAQFRSIAPPFSRHLHWGWAHVPACDALCAFRAQSSLISAGDIMWLSSMAEQLASVLRRHWLTCTKFGEGCARMAPTAANSGTCKQARASSPFSMPVMYSTRGQWPPHIIISKAFSASKSCCWSRARLPDWFLMCDNILLHLAVRRYLINSSAKYLYDTCSKTLLL